MTLPEGTVTFLRSDIEGSMELVRSLGARYDELNAEHAAIVRGAIEGHGGDVVRTEGDAFFAAFGMRSGPRTRPSPSSGRCRTTPGPRATRSGSGSDSTPESAHRAGDDYGGFEVNRAARIAALGWGGQIVLSDTARALIAADLPPDWAIRGLGRHRLKGVPEPEPLFQLDVPGLPTTFPPLRSGVERERPAPRARDDADRPGWMTWRCSDSCSVETRLLTLTGPGGTGKTSLALELARRQAEDFEDGACLVDLQAVDDVDQVAAEIAHGVGLLDGPTGPAADRLEGYLADRALLLVIDNFEQVIGAAPVVGRVLAASPGSRAIVTSRRALRLRIEQEFAVRPLAVVPGQDGAAPEAERLFIERAQRVRPGLTFDAAAMADIGRICRLVDGLPLAIELCAARVGSLPVRVILERLQAHQPLPGSAPQDLPDRQRTLERTVAWSYDLLEPPLQRLYRRLAVFEESFDLAQARAGLRSGRGAGRGCPRCARRPRGEQPPRGPGRSRRRGALPLAGDAARRRIAAPAGLRRGAAHPGPPLPRALPTWPRRPPPTCRVRSRHAGWTASRPTTRTSGRPRGMPCRSAMSRWPSDSSAACGATGCRRGAWPREPS